MPVKILDRLGQLVLELPHLRRELVDPVLPDQPDARLGIGQAHRLGERDHFAPDSRNSLEGRMRDVQQPFACTQEAGVGAERLGGLGLLLGSQGLAGAEPADGNPHRRHRPAQTLHRRTGGPIARFIENCAHGWIPLYWGWKCVWVSGGRGRASQRRCNSRTPRRRRQAATSPKQDRSRAHCRAWQASGRHWGQNHAGRFSFR